VAAVLLLKPLINQFLMEAADGMLEDVCEGRGVCGVGKRWLVHMGTGFAADVLFHGRIASKLS
jgi:hypothetical protein